MNAHNANLADSSITHQKETVNQNTLLTSGNQLLESLEDNSFGKSQQHVSESDSDDSFDKSSSADEECFQIKATIPLDIQSIDFNAY